MPKRLLLFLLLAPCSLLLLQAQAERVTESLNFGWLFQAGDTQDACPEPVERACTEPVERASIGLDDSGWRKVDLPHDFQIEQPWVAPDPSERPDNTDAAANVKSRLSPRGFKEMGIGWYRKTFTPNDAWKGRRVLIDFEGILYVGDAYLNGQLIGKTDYGYLGFEADVTKLLRWGEPNVLAVRADCRSANNSRWYTGAGLYRDVRIITTDPNVYFARHPLRITTNGRDSVFVQAEANYLGPVPQKVTFSVRILDREGRVVAEQKSDEPFRGNQRKREYQLPAIAIPNAHLWDTGDPYLYTAEVTVYHADGTESDRVRSRFGIRHLEFSPTFGMKLNGKKVLLKGIANHHTLGALGAAAYPRAIEKRLRLLKSFGFNHIRTSHNPYSESLLDLCDSLGILVVDELYDKWLTQYCGGRVPWTELWQHDIPEWIRRDRNHPSVVFWSLGNELQTYPHLPFEDWGVTPYRLQKQLVHRYDDTRLITVAMHPRGRSFETDSLPAPLALETDIASYNYRYMYFPGDGRRFPWMMFYQSEASVSAMGPNFYEMDLDKVIGLAYWGAIDYLGESQGWPAKGWAQGVFDISLEPKPKAYLVKSIFKPEEPVVHIGIIDKKEDQMWNGVQTGNDGMSDHWNRREGSLLSLMTYTNAEEVELLLNGRSLGKKQNPTFDPKHRNQIRWDDITYQPGRLEAVAYTDGKVVARHRIETTGKAKRLIAEPDNNEWRADGIDLQHVRIVATDQKGHRVPTTGGKVTFSVEGNARIVGVINGDITSDELTVGDSRSLYGGTCTVILRSTRTPGPVTLIATTPELKSVKLNMNTINPNN